MKGFLGRNLRTIGALALIEGVIWGVGGVSYWINPAFPGKEVGLLWLLPVVACGLPFVAMILHAEWKAARHRRMEAAYFLKVNATIRSNFGP
jgi:hypothetical protein